MRFWKGWGFFGTAILWSGDMYMGSPEGERWALLARKKILSAVARSPGQMMVETARIGDGLPHAICFCEF